MAGDIKAVMTLDDKDIRQGLDRVRRKSGETAGAMRRQFATAAAEAKKETLGFTKVGAAAFAAVGASAALATKGISEYSQINDTLKRDLGALAAAQRRLWQGIGRDMAGGIQGTAGFIDQIESARAATVNFIVTLVRGRQHVDEVNAAMQEQERQTAAARRNNFEQQLAYQLEIMDAQAQGDFAAASRARERLAILQAVANFSDTNDPQQVASRQEAMDTARAIGQRERELFYMEEMNRAGDEAVTQQIQISTEAAKQADERNRVAEAVERELQVMKEQADIQNLRLRGMDDEAERLEIQINAREKLARLNALLAQGVDTTAARQAVIDNYNLQLAGIGSDAEAPARSQVFNAALGGTGLMAQVLGQGDTEQKKTNKLLERVAAKVDSIERNGLAARYSGG